jgi:hypothetical protein
VTRRRDLFRRERYANDKYGHWSLGSGKRGGQVWSMIDVLILVKGVLVLCTPGPPPLRGVVTSGCPGAGDSSPGCRRREQAHAGHKLSAPTPGLSRLPRHARVEMNGAPGSSAQHQTL